jgi:nucleoid DNA-binding protein
MTKADLVDRVANKVNLNKKEAESVINALLQSISDSLSDGSKVEIRGFVAFVLVKEMQESLAILNRTKGLMFPPREYLSSEQERICGQ